MLLAPNRSVSMDDNVPHLSTMYGNADTKAAVVSATDYDALCVQFKELQAENRSLVASLEDLQQAYAAVVGKLEEQTMNTLSAPQAARHKFMRHVPTKPPMMSATRDSWERLENACGQKRTRLEQEAVPTTPDTVPMPANPSLLDKPKRGRPSKKEAAERGPPAPRAPKKLAQSKATERMVEMEEESLL